MRYGRDQEEAEDLLQEGFIKVFKDLASFRGDSAFRTWAYRIVLHTILSYFRKKRVSFIAWEDISNQQMEDGYVDQVHYYDADVIIRQVQLLPIGYRTVFNLHALEGYSFKEIAEQLDIRESTVRSQYVRARKHLKEKVGPLFERGHEQRQFVPAKVQLS